MELLQDNSDDDDIGALGSILSWDEDEDGGVGATGPNSALSDRESSSALPDLVSFNQKDGGLTSLYLQQLSSFPMNQITSGHDASSTNLNNLPLPNPISAFGQNLMSLNETQSSLPQTQQQQEQKTEVAQSSTGNQVQLQIQQQIQRQQLNVIGAPATARQHHQAQPQQAGLAAPAAANHQPHQVSQQAAQQGAVNSNLAAQQKAFALFQQNALLAQSQGKQQPMMGMPNMAQPTQDQQHAAPQFAFADPNAFLRQLQVAQLQQQFNAAAVQQQSRPMGQQGIATGPQATQVPAALQQQMRFQAQVPHVASAPVPSTAQQGASAARKPPVQKKPPPTQRDTASQKKSDTVVSKKAPVVSASDTDGELSSKVGSNCSATASMMSARMNGDIDTSNMSAAEKAKSNRDRNREHARNTRLRKKAYLEKLKTTVDELCRERDTLVSERSGAADILGEMHNTRTEVLMSFFALRSANEKRRELWASILDESCFSCVVPVTPYRSFPASEVQVSKCQRTIMGIDGMIADTASLHVLLNTLVDRSKFPNGNIVFRYTLVTEEAVIAGNQIMARWVMTTLNATECGARMEVAKQGMLCCKFNTANKIVGLELMFDVMALMLQLKQAAGSETFSVIPNTVQTCQRSFGKPMVMTLADEPYTIVQVNKLWEEMTGYNAEEVVGQTSCRILEGKETDHAAVEVLMNDIRFKRPASAMIVNCKKTGEQFRNFFLAYPLSTDSRITHYLHLSTHVDTMMGATEEASQAQQGMPVAIRVDAPGNPQAQQGMPVAIKVDAPENIMIPVSPVSHFDGIQKLQATMNAGQAVAVATAQPPIFGIPPVLSESLPPSSTSGGAMLPPTLGVQDRNDVHSSSVAGVKRQRSG
jgi:PAS domain S-box-containing protein